jgi:hypothetical protein
MGSSGCPGLGDQLSKTWAGQVALGGWPTQASAGGPLKPGFGLSGDVRQLDKVFPPLVRVFVPSIPTRSRPVRHSQLRGGENCSTPGPPDVRTTQPSPDCGEYSAAFPQTAGNFEC